MSAPSGAHVAANGIRQHYLRYRGTGSPLVVVPGITSPAVTWGFVAERLAPAFDVFVLDVRGRGLSQSGPDLDYNLDSLADDLSAFTAALALSEVTVLGHSMGARIGIRAATRSPGSLARLLLVDPPVSGPGRRPYPSKLPWYVDSIRQAVGGMDAEAMRAYCPTWTDEQLALRAEWLHTCYEPAIVTAFEGFHTDDIHRDLSSLSVPAGLMVATRGGVIEPADEAEILSLNPRIRIERVTDAGHMIPWDNLDGFLAATEKLLETKLAGRKSRMTKKLFRIGQIVPSSNTTMETEIPAMLQARQAIRPERFTFHSSRMRMKTVSKDELAAMDGESDRCAAELSDARVDVLGYACLVAIMATGLGYHRQSEARLQGRTRENDADIPVVTSAGALVEGLKVLNAKRIAVVAPYMRPLTELVVNYIREEGFEVVDWRALEIPNNLDVARHDPENLPGIVAGMNLENVDVVVLSACVQMPSLPVVAKVEALTGKPVLTAAVATAYGLLKAVGLERVVPGAGALLSGAY